MNIINRLKSGWSGGELDKPIDKEGIIIKADEIGTGFTDDKLVFLQFHFKGKEINFAIPPDLARDLGGNLINLAKQVEGTV